MLRYGPRGTLEVAAHLTSCAVTTPQSGMAIKDFVALAKIRLSMLVLCTTGVGLWVAPGRLPFLQGFAVLVASAMTVAAANALNSYMERDSDAMMHRTRNRPLPSGRLQAAHALYMGVGLGVVSIAALYRLGGPLCALLAFAAYASYAWMYTPMKRYSWLAVLVGAIPGAIPPVMGYTACAHALDAQAWALFLLMFVWQLPHFFAISIYLRNDYARGGLKVLPLVVGNAATQRWIVWTSAFMVPATALPALWGNAQPWYGAYALLTGGMFMGMAVAGLGDPRMNRWARRMFVASVVHLSTLLGVLMASTW
jgi:protoheme IX farnesyltransferase